jgi:hypothetical protein
MLRDRPEGRPDDVQGGDGSVVVLAAVASGFRPHGLEAARRRRRQAQHAQLMLDGEAGAV